MKEKRRFFLCGVWFYLLCIVFPFGVRAQGVATSPIAVSPGNETTLPSLRHGCPTFSWSPISRATTYRLAVFSCEEGQYLTYQEMSALSSPILQQEIPGPALSWTVPVEESLTENTYIWYVQAVEDSGRIAGPWSAGKMFRVVPEQAFSSETGRTFSTTQRPVIGQSHPVGSEASKPANLPRDEVKGRELISNTFYGSLAGTNVLGLHNSFFGVMAGRFTTLGDNNIFFGQTSGYNTLSGVDNIFIGGWSGFTNTSGYDNLFIGYKSGMENTNGQLNTGMGIEALGGIISGKFNSTYGYLSGFASATGNYNAFFGSQAGNSNQDGHKNSFLGASAGWLHTNGDRNSFLGATTGSAHISGEGNSFLGPFAGNQNQTGNNNTFIATSAGFENISGSGNVFIGYGAGNEELTSNKLHIEGNAYSPSLIYGDFDNSILTVTGKLGINTQTPGYSIEINNTPGNNASLSVKRTDGATNYLNATSTHANFGSVSNHPLRLVVNNQGRLTVNTDNSIVLASGASCTAGGVWTNASSRALKENICRLDTARAVETLSQLHPVTYTYKNDPAELWIGFIAEDVPQLVATNDRKGLSPMDITAVLTTVLKEQQQVELLQQNLLQQEQQAIQTLQKDYQYYQKTLTAVRAQLSRWEQDKQ